MKQISIVIVSFRSDKHVGECLKTIQKNNDIGETLETIIIDNELEGADNRKSFWKAQYPQLEYIPNTLNGGYGQGNNVGIRHASAPLVLIMNPDVRLTGTTPGRICEAFANDARLALLGMRQELGNGAKGRSFLWAPGLPAGWMGSGLLWFSNRFGFFFPRWECIQGSCFALRKSAFERAGLFDETVFMYGEERDIHHRIRALGNAKIACDWSMSYRHLTDVREGNPATNEKHWIVAADWCERNGIGARRYWLARRRHLKAVLAVARLRALGRTTKTVQNLETQLELVDRHLGDNEP